MVTLCDRIKSCTCYSELLLLFSLAFIYFQICSKNKRPQESTQGSLDRAPPSEHTKSTSDALFRISLQPSLARDKNFTRSCLYCHLFLSLRTVVWYKSGWLYSRLVLYICLSTKAGQQLLETDIQIAVFRHCRQDVGLIGI